MAEERQGWGRLGPGHLKGRHGAGWAGSEVQQHRLLLTKEDSQVDTSKCKSQLHDFR